MKLMEIIQEWEEYMLEYRSNISPLTYELDALKSKKIEAFEAEDIEKGFSYLEIESEKIIEIIKALHKMYVPKIAQEAHRAITGFCIKHKQWLDYMDKSLRKLGA